MKNFFINLYSNLTDTTFKTLLFQFGSGVLFFFIAALPAIIYFSNSKFSGDPNDSYSWMIFLSIGILVLELLTVAGLIIYNNFKK